MFASSDNPVSFKWIPHLKSNSKLYITWLCRDHPAELPPWIVTVRVVSLFPGAILGFMLGVFQIPVQECDDLYRKLGSDVFKQNVIVGTVKMGWSHAFYNSEAWENILKSVSLFAVGNPECVRNSLSNVKMPDWLKMYWMNLNENIKKRS